MTKRLLLLITLTASMLIYAGINPAQIRRPEGFSLAKINKNGDVLPIWSGPWQCVWDKKTGLLWEVKSDNEGIHDGYWTYSWYQQGKGVANHGDCYFEDNRCDVADLIRRANEAKTCGRQGWRLPTTTELSSLLDLQGRPGEPKINKAFFPHSKKGDYWTADGEQPLSGTFSHLEAGANAINFGDGKVTPLPYRNAAFVRLVASAL